VGREESGAELMKMGGASSQVILAPSIKIVNDL
jgi:hypothetical protein